MSDNTLEKAAKGIIKNIDALKNLKEKLDSMCPNSGVEVVDLQKVQILDSHYSSWFSFMGGIAAGGLILLITISATVYYTISAIGGFIGFGISGVTVAYIIFDMKRNHKETWRKSTELLIGYKTVRTYRLSMS
jgi:hypothetical protein